MWAVRIRELAPIPLSDSAFAQAFDEALEV
jgi:hypothetical protein